MRVGGFAAFVVVGSAPHCRLCSRRRRIPLKVLLLDERIRRFISRFRIRKPYCVESYFSSNIDINKSK